VRYTVWAKSWDGELRERFGDEESAHELTDDQVIAAIRKFGRASIRDVDGSAELYFENDYD
jgi:hypothetical protein